MLKNERNFSKRKSPTNRMVVRLLSVERVTRLELATSTLARWSRQRSRPKQTISRKVVTPRTARFMYRASVGLKIMAVEAKARL